MGRNPHSYDANGNQLGYTHDANGTRRTLVWDEENRIQSLSDNGHEKTYKYDDAGNRLIKRGPQGETAYINQYFTIRNREIGTKHVYVGTGRIVSKLMKQDAAQGCANAAGAGCAGAAKPGANPNGNTPVEKDLYFYHPDHLGTSNYITDTQGKLYEHLEYFPFGETWVEESTNTQRTPYLFTSKELDEETGLYYFGARYYDPRTSVWQSGDPMLGKYIGAVASRLTNAGVFNSKNLDLYGYAFGNPLRLVDPDGRAPGDPVTTVSLRGLASQQGIGAGLSGVQYNRAVGRAFQGAMLASTGYRENFAIIPSPARAQAGGRPGVMPDAIAPTYDVGFSFKGLMQGQPMVRAYPGGSVVEVKAVLGALTPSHSGHQITGLIDAAARSGAPVPSLTLMTTANTIIAPSTLEYATMRGVAVWQRMAIEGEGGTIKAGPGMLLNPSVLGEGAEARLPGPRMEGVEAPLVGGRPPRINDPDPTQVQ